MIYFVVVSSGFLVRCVPHHKKVKLKKHSYGNMRYVLHWKPQNWGGKYHFRKNSNIGTSHTFSIGKNEYRIAQRDKSYRKRGSIFEVRKNGMPVSLVNIRPKTSTQLLILVVIMGLAFGFTIGVLFYNLFWPAMGV